MVQILFEQDTAATPRPESVLGKGIGEQRSRVTLWTNAGAVVYLATEKGKLQSTQSRVTLPAGVPVVLLVASELWAASPDAGTAILYVMSEEYDES